MSDDLGGNIRGVKIAAVVMGLLIVVGTVVLLVTVARRALAPVESPAAAPVAVLSAPAAALLDEPAGTSIAGIAAAGDRLAVQLRGGGADRVVFIEPRTGAVVGRISLPK